MIWGDMVFWRFEGVEDRDNSGYFPDVGDEREEREKRL